MFVILHIYSLRFGFCFLNWFEINLLLWNSEQTWHILAKVDFWASEVHTAVQFPHIIQCFQQWSCCCSCAVLKLNINVKANSGKSQLCGGSKGRKLSHLISLKIIFQFFTFLIYCVVKLVLNSVAFITIWTNFTHLQLKQPLAQRKSHFYS